MDYQIKRVEDDEISKVAVFLIEQFKEEFSKLAVEKEILVELFSQAMRTEQCFIATTYKKVIGLITYSTADHASFEISMRELKNMMGWKSLRFHCDVMKGRRILSEDQIYLNTLAVHSQYRRQGVATTLLNFLMNEIDAREYLLEVLCTNFEALHLYQRFGFQMTITKKQELLSKLRLTKRISMKYISSGILQ